MGVALSGCASPSDDLLEPPAYTPFLQGNGVYRVTFGVGPAEPRGFTADGRLLVRAWDVPPFGLRWVVLSIPLQRGHVREEASVYRQAFIEDMAGIVTLGERRILSLWKSPGQDQGLHGCPPPAPRLPPLIAMALYGLPPVDGRAIANLPTRFVDMGVIRPRPPPGGDSLIVTNNERVRVTPAMQEVRARGGNPFGPTLIPGSDDVIYSDGEAIWRAAMGDVSQPADSLAAGAYPALNRDGTLLAYGRPVNVDSIVTVWVIPLFGGFCIQEQVEIIARRWDLVLRDLASGDETVLGDGLEPAFDPQAARLVVRAGGLHWVDLATGSRTPIDPTLGAFAPIVSPDGGVLAFALGDAGAVTSTFFLPIAR